VDTIFGFPGGAVIDLYDEMGKHKIRHILVRHEQGAIHMADGYARASGRVGVCLVTSGPAPPTPSPVLPRPTWIHPGGDLHRSGADPPHRQRRLPGGRHHRDHPSCTKHNYLVKDVADLARTIREAFYLASSGRPGPVLVDLPRTWSAARPSSIPQEGGPPGLQAHL